MSSKPKVETTETKSSSTTSKGPLTAQKPLYTDIWGKTQDTVNAATPDQFVAGPSDASRLSVEQMLALAPSLGSNAGGLRDVAGKVANGFFLDPSNDPTFAATADAAIRPITQQLTEKVLPQITDASIRNGGVGGGPAAYGGSRQDIQENQAVRDWEQGAGDITAKLASASRAAGMSLIPQAGAIDTAATAAALTPSQVTGAAGGASTALDQLSLNDTIAKWLAPLSVLQPAAQIAGAGGFSTGTSEGTGLTTQTSSAPSVATQWLQGLTGAAGIAGSLMGMPGVGALTGGLSSLFGGTGGGGGGGFKIIGFDSAGNPNYGR